jgi:hypothetical protein
MKFHRVAFPLFTGCPFFELADIICPYGLNASSVNGVALSIVFADICAFLFTLNGSVMGFGVVRRRKKYPEYPIKHTILKTSTPMITLRALNLRDIACYKNE